MMLAGSSKGMLIGHDQIIFPVKGVLISLRRVGIVGSSTLLEILLKELEHLRPGLPLYTATRRAHQCHKLPLLDGKINPLQCIDFLFTESVTFTQPLGFQNGHTILHISLS
jgi:hypothetical protein